MQRVKVLLDSNKPDEFQTIVNEAIDEALHELRNPKASALSILPLDAGCRICPLDALSSALYCQHASFACRICSLDAALPLND